MLAGRRECCWSKRGRGQGSFIVLWKHLLCYGNIEMSHAPSLELFSFKFTRMEKITSKPHKIIKWLWLVSCWEDVSPLIVHGSSHVTKYFSRHVLFMIFYRIRGTFDKWKVFKGVQRQEELVGNQRWKTDGLSDIIMGQVRARNIFFCFNPLKRCLPNIFSSIIILDAYLYF